MKYNEGRLAAEGAAFLPLHETGNYNFKCTCCPGEVIKTFSTQIQSDINIVECEGNE